MTVVPHISVLIPVRRAEKTLAATLASLIEQCRDQSVEVIVAVGATDPSLAQLAGLDQDLVRMQIVEERAGVPQLRREALLAARGTFIVITEDHCLFPPGWLRGLARAAGQYPGAVCGGPVDNGRISRVGWAQYFTRYAAFLPAHQSGRVTNLPGNNACYPANLIGDHKALLQNGFWEAEFNHALAKHGVSFHLLSELPVVQNQHRTASEYVPLRFRHGRCYGARRSNSLPGLARAKLLLLCPLLPFLLFFRIARSVVLSRWNRSAFLLASPLILIYVFAWSAGEITGYLAGPGQSCTETD